MFLLYEMQQFTQKFLLFWSFLFELKKLIVRTDCPWWSCRHVVSIFCPSVQILPHSFSARARKNEDLTRQNESKQRLIANEKISGNAFRGFIDNRYGRVVTYFTCSKFGILARFLCSFANGILNRNGVPKFV